MDILSQLENLKNDALKTLDRAATSEALTEWLIKYLGRKAELVNVLRGLKDLEPEKRAEVGNLANVIRNELEVASKQKLQAIKAKEVAAQVTQEFLDVTLPGIAIPNGKLHPTTQERLRIEAIFQNMGFTVWDPNLVDDDYHNFGTLNIPEGHPARDMWDTLRIDDNTSLIVHTSSMQHRIISQSQVPIRAIVPGKTFRRESTDARHEHSFFQVEGVYVDRNIKLTDMLGTLEKFLETYFERPVPIKIQPTYFPFVEPGMEIMMQCPVCRGAKPQDCEGCGGSGWMEVIPCGPIHPYVIREAGLDPNVYSGFAWGFGLDRMIMIKNQIDDVRSFHSGDLDFINQF